MEQSALKSTKKILGLAENNSAFDLDVLTFMNSAFFALRRLGIPTATGVSLEDSDPTWDELFPGFPDLDGLKTYVYLRVRAVFDPPSTPDLMRAVKEQREELEAQLLSERNLRNWQPPVVGRAGYDGSDLLGLYETGKGSA